MAKRKWISIAAVGDVPAGRAKFVLVGERRLAVFHLSEPDRFVVTADECPHAGASLAAGEVHGRHVTCYWHAWTFNLDTGECPTTEHATLLRYESRVKAGAVWVRLP